MHNLWCEILLIYMVREFVIVATPTFILFLCYSNAI